MGQEPRQEEGRQKPKNTRAGGGRGGEWRHCGGDDAVRAATPEVEERLQQVSGVLGSVVRAAQHPGQLQLCSWVSTEERCVHKYPAALTWRRAVLLTNISRYHQNSSRKDCQSQLGEHAGFVSYIL